MEQIIARLLGDFESGKMNRRQLIQSLALAASAASVAPAIAADGKGFKATAVNHISYGVPDYGKTRDFYADLLGMKVAFDDGKQAGLEFGDPARPDALYIRKTKQPDNKPLVDHFAFSIAKFNKDAVEAELKRRGLNPKPDSDYGWTILDPDGYTVQICAEKGLYPGAAAPAKK
jgi:catechol 2,3-dioxygenase-like lactoylglutathione lyase family enzyme